MIASLQLFSKVFLFLLPGFSPLLFGAWLFSISGFFLLFEDDDAAADNDVDDGNGDGNGDEILGRRYSGIKCLSHVV